MPITWCEDTHKPPTRPTHDYVKRQGDVLLRSSYFKLKFKIVGNEQHDCRGLSTP